jgi:hypothetical protein
MDTVHGVFDLRPKAFNGVRVDNAEDVNIG